MPDDVPVMQAFAYSLDDLQANRRGTLTPRQRSLVAQRVRINLLSSSLAVIAFVLSAAFLVSAPYLVGEGSAPQRALPYLALTALVFLGVAALFTALGLRRLVDLRLGKISVVAGPLRLHTRRIRQGRWTAYFASMRGIRFQLETEAQYTALTDGVVYRIYYLRYPPTHMILSIETVD